MKNSNEARSATRKPVVEPRSTRSTIKISTQSSNKPALPSARPTPATRSKHYVPTTCRMANRRRPDDRGLAAAARRAGLDPRAARVERKTPFARVNAAYRA